MSEKAELPWKFSSWSQCRNFYAFEAIMRGQEHQRRKSKASKQRYLNAAKRALQAGAIVDQEERALVQELLDSVGAILECYNETKGPNSFGYDVAWQVLNDQKRERVREAHRALARFQSR